MMGSRSALRLVALAGLALCAARRLPEAMRLRPQPPAPCPCADARLCAPVGPAASVEVFGFGSSADWRQFDWDVISTIAWASQPELICTAHQHNARVIAAAPTGLEAAISPDAAVRARWVADTVRMVQAQHLDGITFDYESPLGHADPRNQYYVSLVNETRLALRAGVPGSQVSVCVAWAPDDIDGRAYRYTGLASASDMLYVMVYDTQSQIFGRCIAQANSPAGLYERAAVRYADIGVPLDKLVLGVPWYGYDYPCEPSVTDAEAVFCQIKKVPFRGVNCSDAAGVELGFSQVMQLLSHNSTTGRRFDSSTQSAYFNYKSASDGLVHQVWYDDPQSLQIKYDIASRLGVRGVGPYRYDQLEYSPDDPQTAEMWAALRKFRQNATGSGRD